MGSGKKNPPRCNSCTRLRSQAGSFARARLWTRHFNLARRLLVIEALDQRSLIFQLLRKESTMIRKFVAFACAAVLVMITGCNTIQGAGKDIERGGEKLQGSAERNR
jgi:entericidin B